jgi:hypothetical protein
VPRDQSDQILLPGPGVGIEARNVGTAIDYRLRLAFTLPSPSTTRAHRHPAHRRHRRLVRLRRTPADAGSGRGPCRAPGGTVVDPQLDNRELPMDRAHDEEEDLTRMLIAAAWHQVNYRNVHPAHTESCGG